MYSLKKEQGFTLVEIMVIVVIIALLAAIAIPNLLRARMVSNDSFAKATLRAMSLAAESYGSNNNGNYPQDETSLTGVTPPYLSTAYCANSPIGGYNFDCSGMSMSGYTFRAIPVYTGKTGSTVYTISTGGVLSP